MCWVWGLGETVCTNCAKEISPIQKDLCPACFNPSQYGMTHDHCRGNTHLDGALALVQYRGVVKKIIKEIKYRFAYKALNDFLKNIPKYWYEKFNIIKLKYPNSALCPIPLHPLRQKNRGFNQAELLAKSFEEITLLEAHQFLVRIKNNPPQAQQKSRALRKTNIYRSFQIISLKNSPNTVILVDDLFTSASTANEAARTLKKNGTKHVFLFALAHG